MSLAGSVHNSRGDNVVRMWVKLKRWCVSCVWVFQMGHSDDECDLASTLCEYDLRTGDLFVLSWARVRQVRWGSISSELLMCGGGVSIFVSCVHPMAVLNVAFCMTCSLLILVEDARGNHMEETYSRVGLMTAMSVSFRLSHPIAVSVLVCVEACERVLRCCECM